MHPSRSVSVIGKFFPVTMQSEQAYFRFLLPSVLKEAARFALRRRPPCGDIPHCGVCILRGAFLCIGKFFPVTMQSEQA